MVFNNNNNNNNNNKNLVEKFLTKEKREREKSKNFEMCQNLFVHKFNYIEEEK